jgi:hypothetical protein
MVDYCLTPDVRVGIHVVHLLPLGGAVEVEASSVGVIGVAEANFTVPSRCNSRKEEDFSFNIVLNEH